MVNIQTIKVSDDAGVPVPAQAISIPNRPGTLAIAVIGNYVEMATQPADFEGYPGHQRSIRINDIAGGGQNPFTIPIPPDLNGQLWFYCREAGAPNATVSVMIMCGEY